VSSPSKAKGALKTPLRTPLGRLPAIQFYVGDWKKDPGIRACSLAARGLWFEMLCIAFEARRRGYLEHANGEPIADEDLARMVGADRKEVVRLLAELDRRQVFSRTDDGIIYSRRMRRDEEVRQARAAGGEKGAEHGVKGAAHGHKGGRPATADKGGFVEVERGVLEPPSKPPPSSSSSSSEEKDKRIEQQTGAFDPFAGEVEPGDPAHGRALYAEEFRDEWNRVLPWAAFEEFPPNRGRVLRTRLGEAGWIGRARRGMQRANESAYLRGEVHPFKMDIDWFLNEDNLTRILEGRHDDRKPVKGKPEGEARLDEAKEAGNRHIAMMREQKAANKLRLEQQAQKQAGGQ
jgi:hypothetical protein